MTMLKLTETEQLSDWDLIQRILDGDKSLLEILYDRYASKAFYKCLSITKDPEISKDLSHDIMIKVFMSLSSFKGTSDFSFWVYSITYNYCMDYLRKQKKTRFDSYDAIAFDQVSTDEIELENKILKDLQIDQLHVLFKRLKEVEKLILLMRYQDGMTVKQIAATLNIGESAIKMRLKRSRDQLAQLLKDVEDEE